MRKWNKWTKPLAAITAAALMISPALTAFAEEAETETEAQTEEAEEDEGLFSLLLDWAPEQVSYPLTVDNGDGEELVIEEEPARVVSVSPSLTEILFALDAGDKLVGRSDYDDYPAEVLDIESVGQIYGADIEKILSLEPDLVLASAHFSDESLAQLKDADVPVLYLYNMADVAGVLEIIKTMGTVFNREEEAWGIDYSMALEIELVKAAVADADPVSVYYVVGYGEYGDYTATGDTYIHTILTLAGGDNVAADGQYWSYSVEELLEKDPAYIIVPAYAYEDFIATEPYTELTAVKEGRVYPIDNNLLDRQIPRNADAILEIAELLHPAEIEALFSEEPEVFEEESTAEALDPAA